MGVVMRSGYMVRFIVSLVVAVVSGYLVIDLFYGKLGSGDTSVWPLAAVSFIAFGVSAPMAVYYYGRRNHQTVEQKMNSVIESEGLKTEEDYGKE